MNLLIFAASHRPLSLNRKLALQAARQSESQGIKVDYAEYSDFDMPVYNDDLSNREGIPDVAHSFGKRAAKTDGIIISTPEYNWSYPGSLKNIIDWTSKLSPNPLAGKTALLMSATPGSRGGITGLHHLKTPLEAMQIFVFPRVFALGNAESAFDAKGLKEPKQQKLFTAMLTDYIAFAKKLSNT
jgi:chromate reductase